MRVGITGQSGFIGSHLYSYLKTDEDVTLIPFQRRFFENLYELDKFLLSCDAVVHLAGANRGPDEEVYEANVGLAETLVSALERTGCTPHLIFSSSTHETRDTAYGRSKLQARQTLSAWAQENEARFTGLIIPNVYGPFCRPFYNSVVATFCHQLTHGQEPEIKTDQPIGLIYIDDLLQKIHRVILYELESDEMLVPPNLEIKVSELLEKLQGFKQSYIEEKVIPDLSDPFDLKLFNTFRSYLEPGHYPVQYDIKKDHRGILFEAVRALNGGQAFLSTTKPGVERGNHYHRRKLERFSIVKGRALVQLRRVGTEAIQDYILSGDKPSFIDIPVLHTHNLINIGEEELLMLFWASELYNPEDPDTYYEAVNEPESYEDPMTLEATP
jgi:UDP-2-acetamido-2,6-beta-L-arabino-hexul-4-ose reductase